jgi:hypothetical protein
MPVSAVPVPNSALEWARFTRELADAGLPTRFLTLLPAEFVQLEFTELKTAAAEYHPTGHRMVFHLALSENHEGRRFRSVKDISNHELATMYHELFHAYFDYLDFAAGSAGMPEQAARILQHAKRLVSCRYTVVDVVAGPAQRAQQRKVSAEHRRLSENEGWDALNETWGVFVGWAIWNKLEVTHRFQTKWDAEAVELFWNRLSDAHEDGILTGYFEPADLQARQVLPRLYLARSNAISIAEIALLLEGIIEESPGLVGMMIDSVAAGEADRLLAESCGP